MKIIYISIPISGHEDTYEQRLYEAVEYVKKMYPDVYIITPKEIAERLKDYQPMKPTYKDYLLADMEAIAHCDAIFMCNGWYDSKGCFAEIAFASALGLEVLHQNNKK